MFFSDKLRLLRTQANLSQEDLADELHVSRQSVSKWESGISFPEIEKLISISDYFHVSSNWSPLCRMEKLMHEKPCNWNKFYVPWITSCRTSAN